MTNRKRKARPLFAYCWRGGQIGFGRKLPTGALHLMAGTDKAVRDAVGAMARHARTNEGLLLVPGVPEAINEDLARKAVSRFTRMLQPGFRFSREPRDYAWVCEFCFTTTQEPKLPESWELIMLSAVCGECQPKIEAAGGINVVKGGAYAGDRRDPREWADVECAVHASGKEGR